jgi:hypothetical protein
MEFAVEIAAPELGFIQSTPFVPLSIGKPLFSEL